VTLRILFETGLRISEAVSLKYEDIDQVRGSIRFNRPLKNGCCRELKISDKLIAGINTLHAKGQWLPDRWCMTKWIIRHRQILAESQNNDRFNSIHLHSFRHYYASNLYHKSKDLLLVKSKLGHKAIQNTMIYTQLIEIEEDPAYTCKMASNLKEAEALISSGFEYISTMDGVQLYRKRK